MSNHNTPCTPNRKDFVVLKAPEATLVASADKIQIALHLFRKGEGEHTTSRTYPAQQSDALQVRSIVFFHGKWGEEQERDK